jgi:hypothetical protein
MNAFWFGFFTQFRDCGRSAAWFLVTLGGMFVALVLIAWAVDHGHGDSIVAGIGVTGLVLICFLAAAIRRALRDRRHHLKFPGLSEDEVKKARAKLARRANLARTLPVAPAKLRTRAPVGEVY